MGKEKTTKETTSQGTQTVTPQLTEAEKEFQELQLEQARATQSGSIEAQTQGLDLVNRLLGGQELPGYLQPLPAGIDEPLTQEISQKAISDLQPQFQNSGLLDSGVNASISARTAGDIRRSVAEFNLNNLLQLLNLGVGGQAQVQHPIQANASILSSRLASSRPVTTTSSGSTNSTLLQMNPFMKSFQQSFGSGLGKGSSDFLFGGVNSMMPTPT